MKLGPVTKLDKSLKSLAMALCRQILMSLSFFRFMANFEQSGSRIPDAWSVKLTFSLIITFSQKLKTELINLKHSSHAIALSKGTIFDKKC